MEERVYCPRCNLRVAPYDTRKVEKDGKTYHSNCKEVQPQEIVQMDLKVIWRGKEPVDKRIIN